MTRSPEMVCGLLAALDRGAAYLPIDPGYPSPASTTCSPTHRHPYCSLLPDGDDADWRCDGLALAISAVVECSATKEQSVSRPNPATPPTSSSRRVRRVWPKGVVIEHRSIVNRLRWMDDTFHTPDDRVAQKTPYSFDVSVVGVLLAAIRGASLVLMTPGSRRTAPRWPPSSPGAASPSAISSRPRWLRSSPPHRRRQRWKRCG